MSGVPALAASVQGLALLRHFQILQPGLLPGKGNAVDLVFPAVSRGRRDVSHGLPLADPGNRPLWRT